MILIFYIAGLILLIYCGFIAYVTTCFIKPNVYNQEYSNKISIIIPCRNEVKNIANCLNSIAKQSLSVLQYEVIVVDDFSEDETIKVAEQFKNMLPLTIFKNTLVGKKNALTLGILSAKNEIIVTTDADCTMHSNWLSEMLKELESNDLNMLCGPINFNDSNRLFEQLQQTESAAIVGISMVMLNKGKPSTCNGANLMFRKSKFNKIGGYQNHFKIASGDDDLLMHEFYQLDPTKVKYCMNNTAMVFTNSCDNFTLFLHQRMRWLAKRNYYIFPWNGYLQQLVFWQLIAFYYLMLYGFLYWSLMAFCLLTVKLIFDMSLGIKLKGIFKFNFIYILIMPFFEFYIFILLLFAGLMQKKWKGRGI